MKEGCGMPEKAQSEKSKNESVSIYSAGRSNHIVRNRNEPFYC